MAHYKRSNARKLAREKAKKDFYHIVDTTSSTYGKKGNVNSMNICSNTTKSKYGNETQTAIQNKIADFICNDLCKEEFNGGGNDCSKAAILAKFTRKSHETNKIHIGDLIELEKYIWKG
jgi:hypothetical protein